MTKRSMMMVSALALLAGGCDPDELALEDRELGVVVPGGDEGSDQADESWDEGEPQVCEPVPVEDQALAIDGRLDDLTAPAEIAEILVKCPMNGVASTTYIGYTCNNNGLLTCKHFCDCDYTYTSPCNPPHADCGVPAHGSTAIEGMWDQGDQIYCNAIGWMFCRKQTSLSALQKCTDYCKSITPTRTRNCPDCPKP